MDKLIRDCRQEQTIVFLHIPKAAGSTLNEIIRRQYDPDAILSVYAGDEEIDIHGRSDPPPRG